MATLSKPGFTLIRLSLIVVVAVSLLQSFRILNSVTSYQNANILLNSAHEIRDGDFTKFLDQLAFLEADVFPDGSIAGIKAHAQSLVFSRSIETPLVSELEVKDSYLRALEFYPYDGYLWAKLAIHLSRLEGVSSQMLNALDSAMRYARNDYHTFQVLLEIAIRDWPRFDCVYKERMLSVVHDSLHVDDRLLSRWSSEHGGMNIDGLVTSLMTFYNFDPLWAANEVSSCRRNTVIQEG